MDLIHRILQDYNLKSSSKFELLQIQANFTGFCFRLQLQNWNGDYKSQSAASTTDPETTDTETTGPKTTNQKTTNQKTPKSETTSPKTPKLETTSSKTTEPKTTNHEKAYPKTSKCPNSLATH